MNTTDKPLPTAEELESLRYQDLPSHYTEFHRVASMQAVLDHLKPWLRDTTQPAALPWVSLKERKPTKEDADEGNCVTVTEGTRWWRSVIGNCASATHFLPFSPPAQPSQDELDREAFEKEWSNVSDFSRTANNRYATPHVETLWLGFKSAMELSRKQP